MKRCECGNADRSLFIPFSAMEDGVVRRGQRCLMCSRFELT